MAGGVSKRHPTYTHAKVAKSGTTAVPYILVDGHIAARINTINYIITTCRIRHFMLRVAVHVYFFEMMPSTPALSCYLCPSGPTCVFADYASQIQGFTNARPYYAYVSSFLTSENNKINKIITTS